MFTLWPFVVPLIGLLFEATGMLPSTAATPPAAFVLLLALLYSTPVIILGLVIFYLVYLFTRSKLPLDWIVVWAAVLMIVNVFAMPVFWYLVIWKPRQFAPLQTSSRFSLLVFSPLLIQLLLPLMYLFTMNLLSFPALSSGPDSIEITRMAIQWAWVVGPIPGAACIFLVGRLSYTWLFRAGATRLSWTILWGIFSILSLPVAWYAVVVLRPVLPSDALPYNLKGLTKLAIGIAIVVQPLVIPWLFIASRLWHGFEHKLAQESSSTRLHSNKRGAGASRGTGRGDQPRYR